MSKSSKKWIASLAALQILVYHCWIPVFRYGTVMSSVERFLVAATYPGVDVFFFISAYSLASRPVDDYGGFLKNRALKLLPLFFIALTLGQFLWFIPSIMIMYVLMPPLHAWCKKRPGLASVLLTAGWVCAVYLILGVLKPSQDLGIFLFRIPGIVLGAYAAKYMDRLSEKQALRSGIILLVLGLVLVYKYGYTNKLNVPYRGTFYLTGIPVTLGTVLLTDRLAEGRRSPALEAFGSMTLELYFTQMVLGSCLVGLFYPLTESRILTNLLVIGVITALAAVIKKLNDLLLRKLQPQT